MLIIIGILFGIIFTGSQLWFSECSGRKKARAEVISISLALDKFKNEEGDYPEADLIKKYCGARQNFFMSLSGWLDVEGAMKFRVMRSEDYLVCLRIVLPRRKIPEILSNRYTSIGRSITREYWRWS